MSKHKRIASVQAEAAAQKNVDTILQNMHKGQKQLHHYLNGHKN